MRIPLQITAGDSADWIDFSFADTVGASVASSQFELKYSLRGPAAEGLDLVGESHGSGWKFSLPMDRSAALNTSAVRVTWFWQAYATRGAQRITAGTGQLFVLPNLAGIAGAFDGRSQAEQALQKVEAALLARVNGDLVTEYTIHGRSLKKESTEALMALRKQYRRIVSRERKRESIKNGQGNPDMLGARFIG